MRLSSELKMGIASGLGCVAFLVAMSVVGGQNDFIGFAAAFGAGVAAYVVFRLLLDRVVPNRE